MAVWEPQGCCCFTRRTGCLILGGIAVAGALLTILSLTHLAISTNLKDVVDAVCEMPAYKAIDNCSSIMPKILVGGFVYDMVRSVIVLIIYSLLIHGVRKDRASLMVPVMVFLVIEIGLGILFSAGLVIYQFLVYPMSIILVAGILAAVMFLATYFLLVIRAYYLELRRESGESHRVLVESPSEKECLAKEF